ncbi:MAG TPA: hypothetical protein VLF89_01210 [Candidatus Saccharimonadales bacterium]|nr:hypothetical protein [Candidatus Saccharimonadales bacterium]
MKKKYSLTIGWLYPDLMSIYGDRGNIICLQKRSEWRGINVNVKRISLENSPKELATCDVVFAGGAQDSQQTLVFQDLKESKGKVLQGMIEDSIPGLYICGAYQFLGKYYKEADGTTINGLGIFDLHTINPGENHKRLIGNVSATLNQDLLTMDSGLRTVNSLVGFENHGGRTYLGEKIKPLATIIQGFGNNGEDKTEGAIYKNSLGSYFHGPILPKNPQLADFLIKKALEKKYKENIVLTTLDDTLAYQAHKAILKNIGK